MRSHVVAAALGATVLLAVTAAVAASLGAGAASRVGDLPTVFTDASPGTAQRATGPRPSGATTRTALSSEATRSDSDTRAAAGDGTARQASPTVAGAVRRSATRARASVGRREDLSSDARSAESGDAGPADAEHDGSGDRHDGDVEVVKPPVQEHDGDEHSDEHPGREGSRGGDSSDRRHD